MSTCENCKFGREYEVGEPPKPKPYSFLFGLIKGERVDELDQEFHEAWAHKAQREMACDRYPKPLNVSKWHWCGEWQPAASHPQETQPHE